MAIKQPNYKAEIAEIHRNHRVAILEECSIAEIMEELTRRGRVSDYCTIEQCGIEHDLPPELKVVDISDEK